MYVKIFVNCPLVAIKLFDSRLRRLVLIQRNRYIVLFKVWCPRNEIPFNQRLTIDLLKSDRSLFITPSPVLEWTVKFEFLTGQHYLDCFINMSSNRNTNIFIYGNYRRFVHEIIMKYYINKYSGHITIRIFKNRPFPNGLEKNI